MALCEPAPRLCNDDVEMKTSSNAFQSSMNAVTFHDQADLWMACGGGYDDDNEMQSSDDDLNTLSSMVCALQHNNDTAEDDAFATGLHRNTSFDSGSTSHDSCTASFSSGSPVTVLPPLSYSCCDGKDIESSYVPYMDGLWTAGDLVSDNDQMLQVSSSGGQFSSLLLPELPLRSFETGVNQVRASNEDEYALDCVIPTSISSISSEQSFDSASDKSASTPESQRRGIDSSFCSGLLVGHEFEPDNSISPHAAVGSLANRTSPISSTSLTTSAVSTATVQERSVASPTIRRRLSWTDFDYSSTTAKPMPLTSQTFSANLHANNGSRAQLSHQFLSNTFANTHPLPNIQNAADFIATSNPYSRSQDLLKSPSSEVANLLKRPHSATLSSIPSKSAVQSASLVSASLNPKLDAARGHHQDAATLSALLYKNNLGSDSLAQKLQAGSGMKASGLSSAKDSVQAPPPKLRRRHGTATDPQSIAARTRREKFSDRIRLLQSLVPNGERLDTVSMLGHTLEYVRFLQHQVWQLYNGGGDPAGQPDAASREKWKEFRDMTTMAA